jgi:hypothetical protein
MNGVSGRMKQQTSQLITALKLLTHPDTKEMMTAMDEK